MANLNVALTRKSLQDFEFHDLFIEELGWSQPSSGKPVNHAVDGVVFSFLQIAQLGGVAVFEVTSSEGQIPSGTIRKSLQKEISKAYHENLLIFIDQKIFETVLIFCQDFRIVFK